LLQVHLSKLVFSKRMPADSFVGIWKFVARPNLCETPACVKPPPRYMPPAQRTSTTDCGREIKINLKKMKKHFAD